MRLKKFSTGFIIILMISVGLFFSGCYTQFSRPDVETEYYPQDDEQYESEYYSEEDYDDVDINYYDIYLQGASPPVYYGPHVWTYWSPYYRWYGYDRFYDPWLNDYMYTGFGVYAPFWDPWLGGWNYHNYYYYNPPHNYYWTYEDGHGSWNSKPKKKRNFRRGGSDPGEERYLTKQKQPSSHKKIVETVEKFVPRDKSSDDRIISISQRPVVTKGDKSEPKQKVKTKAPRVPKHHSKLDRESEPKSITPANKSPKTKKSPADRRSKRISKPKTSKVPRDKSRVNKPSKRQPSRDSVKKSSPPKSSKPARVKSAPSRSKPSYKSAPPKSSSSGSKSSGKKSSKSSSSKSGDKKRK